MRHPVLPVLLFAVLLAAAYSNHFHNAFHFDDGHTISANPYVRDLSNIPKFFTDPKTFSTLPTHQVYRPVLTTTLAIDYVRGGGEAFAFHVTTFVFFLIYLATVAALFRLATGDLMLACVATGIYGLHPVCAETVNYIVQRAEILSTLGVIAGLALYAAKPGWRRWGLYLLPVVLALLTKPPALIFPALLIAWAMLFESRTLRGALRDAVPALVVCGVMALFLNSMTAGTFNAGGASAAQYRITQMYAALYYFGAFFAPVHLNADTDWRVLPGFSDPRAIAGLAFLIASGFAIWQTARRPSWKPVAFGLVWFFAALFPTSWMPLAEVVNDHRMFFPFVGLTLAVVWTASRLVQRVNRNVIAVAIAVLFCAEAWGTYARNEVWRNEETLWRDVVAKSPGNGRGLMNYGRTFMEKGDYRTALDYFERARVITPNWFFLEINLGITKAQLGRTAEAEQHFQYARQLEPQRYESYFYYARWLSQTGRRPEAVAMLRTAVQLNPAAMDAQQLLDSMGSAVQQAEAAAHTSGTAENWLTLSLAYYNESRFEDCIRAAQEALRVRPAYAEAWNNIAAAHNAMRHWDEGIRAADEALRINPAYELARNNRTWAVSQRGSVTP